MYTDEDYLDELLKSIEPITKQIEEPEPEPEPVVQTMPEPEPVVEPMVQAMPEPVAEPIVQAMPEPVAEPIAQAMPEPVVEPIAQAMPEPTVESGNKSHANIDDEIDLSSFGWGGSEGGEGEQEDDLDIGMSEAEIDALINAAKNTPLPPETDTETASEDLFTDVGSMESLFGNASDNSTMDSLFADADTSSMDTLFAEANKATLDSLFGDADTSSMDTLFTDADASGMDTLFTNADTSAMDTLFTDVDASGMDTLFTDADASGMDTLFTDTDTSSMDTLFSNADTSAMDTLFAEPDNSAMDMLFSDGNADNMEMISSDMSSGQDDMAALLGQFKDDSDLSDIMNLLEKDENNEVVDESLLSAYESAAENVLDLAKEDAEGTIPEKKEKKGFFKKREKKEKVKKEKKSKKKETETAEEAPQVVSEDLLFEGVDELESIKEKKVKKPGLFSKILQILTEEEEEPDKKGAVPEADATGITDENLAILNELSDEDKKKKIKADKKNKKGKKGKKGKNDSKDNSDEIEEKGKRPGRNSDDSEDEEKDDKKKKKKKEKKPKKMKVMELEVPEKKIPRKYIIAAFVFCFTIMAVIIIVSSLYTSFSNLSKARWAFDNEDYQTCYENLYGEKLSEEDQLLFDKSAVILSMQRKLDSYENFRQLGMDVEALNALFEGVTLYDRLIEKAYELNVAPRVENIYQTIRGKFAEFDVTDEMIEEILSYESATTYTRRLQSIVYGTPFEENLDQTEEVSEETETESEAPLEDVLEEEMDFLPEDVTETN